MRVHVQISHLSTAPPVVGWQWGVQACGRPIRRGGAAQLRGEQFQGPTNSLPQLLAHS